MIIDLHIHSKNGSDGRWDVEDIFAEADRRGIGLISITDHDSLAAQERALSLARDHHMRYVTGVELNVSFSHPGYNDGCEISLDLIGYGFDIRNAALLERLDRLRHCRIERARKILENINEAFRKEGLPGFTQDDMSAIAERADGGALARPHIANYLIEKGIVQDKLEAFDRYLVRCDVPKMFLSLEEASALVRRAGGRIVLAHPGDPKGTSLMSLAKDVMVHKKIIREAMLDFIDGIECWHTRHSRSVIRAYAGFAGNQGLIATGGSDCHQQPPIMGSVQVPAWVADQFSLA